MTKPDYRNKVKSLLIMQYNKSHIAAFAFILFLLPVFTLQAQEAKTLSLKEAVELSIKNSKQLQLSKAKIDEAVAATKEASQRRTPDVNMSANYLRLNSANAKLAGTGDSSSKSPISINQVLYGTANVSYPIFAGFKIKFGIESAQYLEKAATLDADNDKQEVILNIISAYVNLYKANVAAQLVQENLSQSRQRDTDFTNLEKNGLLARNDLLKSELQTSQFELNLLDAQNAIQLAQVNMNLMLGLPESTKLIIDSASLMQTQQVKTIDEYEQLATQNRYDVQALNNRKKAADDAIKIAKGDYYPSIGISGGYAAVDIPKFLTVTNAFNLGIGVKYSLSSLWRTDAKVQQAKARAQQLQVSEAILNDVIHLSINKAYEDYFSELKKIDVLNKQVEQSLENYRISKNKYNNSLLTLTDLLEADVAQLKARLDLSIAKADAYLSYETLLQKAGLLSP